MGRTFRGMRDRAISGADVTEARTSDHLWHAETFEDWENFLKHDAENPSRDAAYRVVAGALENLKSPASFAEIGFGNCIDFSKCFKRLHDSGAIAYHGFDMTLDFVNYARYAYPGYCFDQATFLDLHCYESCDIAYTRATFEHAPPEEYRSWLRGFLRFAGKIAVIGWFIAPQPEPEAYITWSDAWNNRYVVGEVLETIVAEGFTAEIQELNPSDHIYLLKREDIRDGD